MNLCHMVTVERMMFSNIREPKGKNENATVEVCAYMQQIQLFYCNGQIPDVSRVNKMYKLITSRMI